MTTPSLPERPSLTEQLRGDPRFQMNFWMQVEKRGACWIWTANRTRQGYGRTSFMYRPYPAHRVAYMLVVGAIPAGMTIDHVCHTRDKSCVAANACEHRGCVNPDHLEVVTVRENILRGRGITAHLMRKTHCIRGHELSTANTRSKDGHIRRCRLCEQTRDRERRERRKAERLVAVEA